MLSACSVRSVACCVPHLARCGLDTTWPATRRSGRVAGEPGRAGSAEGGDTRFVALTEELGTQLRRMPGAGPKIAQLLSMIELQRPSGEAVARPLGTPTVDRDRIPFRAVRRVIEQDLDTRVQDVFAALDEQPFAISSLGQVHRARTRSGEHVAVKVQHPDLADAIDGDLRTIGLVSPIVGRLAPGSDAGALLREVRERVADELDYELEAQQQRRLARLFRGHPHVRVPGVHTDLSSRRVLVTEYVDGLRSEEIAQLDEPQRDRVGEIAFRFFFGLLWRERIVAGDPHPDNCLLCPDGRVCMLDFALLRRLDDQYLDGERAAMRAVIDADPDAVQAALEHLGYLAKTQSYDPATLLEHLATAGEWLLAEGFRRIDPDYVRRTLEVGYPPRSPWISVLRRLTFPSQTLLLRRMEVQMLSLLGTLRAGGDWAAIAAEHWADQPRSTPLGREDAAFFEQRGLA
jgi:ABC1 atypical kinase-like domain